MEKLKNFWVKGGTNLPILPSGYAPATALNTKNQKLLHPYNGVAKEGAVHK